MKISQLSQNIVTVPYERSGESAELSVNIDAFTPAFFRGVGEMFKERMAKLTEQGKKNAVRKKRTKQSPVDGRLEFFETEATALEITREINVDLLTSGVLVGWTVTDDDGIPIPPSKEILIKQSPRFIEELWNLCLDAAKTVKKRAESETRETSDNTQDGSPGLRVVGQNT